MLEMAKFKVGDIVRLKSGGPHMTLESFGDFTPGPPNGVKCVWFDDKHNKMEDVFARKP